jgi:phage baseplate assembly protein W
MSENDFLGIGWNFPPDVDETGQVKMARYEESIRQSIWMILSTSPGERLMRPTFGSNLQDLVFRVNNAGLAGAAAGAARDALAVWEPRIDVLGVNAFADQANPNLLHIEINYQVRATNSRFNLVYPFYLEQA